MRTIRDLALPLTAIACLLSGSAVIGASNDGRRQQDNTSTPTPLFYPAFVGAHSDDVQIPEALVGDNLTVVYQRHFGLYPYIHNGSGSVINGGVPQRTNIAAHLREIARDIDELIPDPEYDGYVVIDYEGWRPFWEDTSRQYQDMSRELVREEHPGWDEARIERKSRVGFEAAAKKLLTRTLDQCHAMRPNAKWGIYSYPMVRFRNNDARWLWSRLDAFFPQIYMTHRLVPDDAEPGLGEIHESEYLQRILVKRVKYAREIAGDRPVLAFVWPRYTRRNPDQWLRYKPLTQSDLALCLEGPLLHGADGVVIWENIPQPGIARAFQDQIDESIAPELRRILEKHGRAIDDAIVSGSDNKAPESDDVSDSEPPRHDDRLSATQRGSRSGVKKYSRRSRGGGG